MDLVYSINRNTTELYFQLLLTLLLYSPFSYINNIEIEVILSIYKIFHSSLKYRLESNLVSSKLRDDINGKKFFITCYDIDNGVFAVQKNLEQLKTLIHVVFDLIRCYIFCSKNFLVFKLIDSIQTMIYYIHSTIAL